MAKKAKKELTLEEKLQNALVADWEQPSALPENWVWTRLGEIFSLQAGKFINASAISRTPNKSFFPCYGGNGLRGFVEIFNREGSYPLIGRQGALCGNIHKATGRFYATEHAIVVDTFEKTNAEWACIFLKELNLNQYATSTAQPGLSVTKINSVSIPLPPLAEQERIVQRIESLFAKLDTAKELLEEALESFESRKSALLHQAFTGELTKTWREKHGVSMDTWEEKNIGDITTIKSSKRIFANDYQKNGIPFYRSSEIVDIYDNGTTQPQFFISEKKYNEIKEKFGIPQQGDLLVTSVGTIGKTWLVDGRKFYYKDGNLTQLTSSTKFSMRYVQLFISSQNFIRQVNSTVGGTAYNALTIIKFKSIIIPIPTLLEQEEIVRILDAQLQKEEEAKAHIQHSLAHIEHMKKAILARAFRGELGTHDPKDGHALELLKEILSQERPTPKEKKPSKKFVIPKELTKKLAISALEKFIYESIAEKQEVTIQEILTYNKDSLKIIQSLDRMEKMNIITKLSDTKYTIKD